MNDHETNWKPKPLDAIRKDTEELGFTMGSEPRTGALLAVLAASKPGGRFLELGTGTGLGTAWLLSGMDADARLDTVDSDADVVAVAKRHLGAVVASGLMLVVRQRPSHKPPQPTAEKRGG